MQTINLFSSFHIPSQHSIPDSIVLQTNDSDVPFFAAGAQLKGTVSSLDWTHLMPSCGWTCAAKCHLTRSCGFRFSYKSNRLS